MANAAVSNGPAFSPGGDAAYFADTFGPRILRFDLDRNGAPVAQSIFATIPDDAGYPDGMTVDSAGTLHVAHWDGARISRISGEGQQPIGASEPPRQCVQTFGRAAGSHDRVAAGQENFGGGSADARAAAGDEGYFR